MDAPPLPALRLAMFRNSLLQLLKTSIPTSALTDPRKVTSSPLQRSRQQAQSPSSHSNSPSTPRSQPQAPPRFQSCRSCPRSPWMVKAPQPRCSSTFGITRLEYMRSPTHPSCPFPSRHLPAKPRCRLGLSRAVRRDMLISTSRTRILARPFSHTL